MGILINTGPGAWILTVKVSSQFLATLSVQAAWSHDGERCHHIKSATYELDTMHRTDDHQSIQRRLVIGLCRSGSVVPGVFWTSILFRTIPVYNCRGFPEPMGARWSPQSCVHQADRKYITQQLTTESQGPRTSILGRYPRTCTLELSLTSFYMDMYLFRFLTLAVAASRSQCTSVYVLMRSKWIS
jgi:hypothetical protein